MAKVSYEETTLLLLRLMLAFIFLWHGIPKLLNLAGTMAFFSSLGLPGFVGPIVGTIEVVAAVLVLVGLYHKWANYALTAVIAVAIILVQAKNGVTAGFERDMLILISTLVLAAHGPGHLAFHKKRR